MENLADILKRLAATKQASNGSSNGTVGEPPFPPTDERDEDACPMCGGRGWYTPDVVVGHPDFGRVITCQCQRQRLSDERLGRLFRYSNLGRLSRFTFDSLKTHGLTDDAESQRFFSDAHRAAVEYAENPKGWLVLVGPNGSGKTHLAAAIANHCIKSEHVVFFMHVPDLLDDLRATYAPTSELTYSDLYMQVVEAPLLVLDGLGAHSATPWAQEKLQQIINHRFNSELPTVVTTASDLAALDPYIRSRLEALGLSRLAHTGRHMRRQTHQLGRIPKDMLRSMTFGTFGHKKSKSAEEADSLDKAARIAGRFAENPDGWLTLYGDTGVGKTHLAIAIANVRLQEGHPVFFVTVQELLDYLRGSLEPDNFFRYDAIFDEVKNTPLLILDDLGKELPRPWNEAIIHQIIVHRHNNRLPSIITSLEDFSQQSGPVGSRIRDTTLGHQVVHIEASDYRNE